MVNRGKITQADVNAWGACYEPEKVAAEWRRLRWPEAVEPLRVARARSISVEDRLWVLLRPEVLGDRFGAVLDCIVQQAHDAVCAARADAAAARKEQLRFIVEELTR